MAVDKEMEAVFKSSRTQEVDPVSGNEVPTGSLPEEVRDDIPAQLSEGEYVVPADVVRYYGVRFFEDLRNQAKMGWQEMEANGRIGGEPVAPEGMEMGGDDFPFSLEELQVVEAAEGAYINGYADGGAVDIQTLQQQYPSSFVGDYSMGSGEEYKTFTNPEGMTITIRFINGKPVTPVPPGYTEAGTAVEEAAPKKKKKDKEDKPSTPQAEAVDWDSADADTFRQTIDTQFGRAGKTFQNVATTINPLVGLGLGAANRMQNNKMLEALDKRIAAGDPESDEIKELSSIRKDLLNKVDRNSDGKADNAVERSGIFGGESGLMKNLKDTDESGDAGFGDTWLGDLLGFDGEAGVQGAGLQESRQGGRRKNTRKKKDKKPVVGDNDSGDNSFAQDVANFFTPNDGKSYKDGKLVDDEE